MKVCCVVGFPLGAQPPETKAMEARAAIRQGAKEIDMVINVGALKSGDDELVLRDIRSVVEACRDGSAKCKVILETSLLTNEEKARACELAVKAHADFVKTSTGFSTGGATVEDVALMSRIVRDKGLGVKASGGVRSLADLRRWCRPARPASAPAAASRFSRKPPAQAVSSAQERNTRHERNYIMADLRSYIFLDSLQPQVASFFATVSQGFLPIAGQASLFVEISPGMEINFVTDVALKSTKVTPGMQIIERLYGMLEIHSESQADVRSAGAAILDSLESEGRGPLQAGHLQQQRHPPHRRLSHDAHQPHAPRQHDPAGPTLFTMEVAPAAYAAFAANEAEKSRGDQHPGDSRLRQLRPHLPRRRGEGHRRRLRRPPNRRSTASPAAR